MSPSLYQSSLFMPDVFGLLPSNNGVLKRKATDKFVKIANKKNINKVVLPTASQLSNPLYSIPDEVQLQGGQSTTKKPRKLVKSIR